MRVNCRNGNQVFFLLPIWCQQMIETVRWGTGLQCFPLVSLSCCLAQVGKKNNSWLNSHWEKCLKYNPEDDKDYCKSESHKLTPIIELNIHYYVTFFGFEMRIFGIRGNMDANVPLKTKTHRAITQNYVFFIWKMCQRKCVGANLNGADAAPYSSTDRWNKLIWRMEDYTGSTGQMSQSWPSMSFLQTQETLTLTNIYDFFFNGIAWIIVFFIITVLCTFSFFAFCCIIPASFVLYCISCIALSDVLVPLVAYRMTSDEYFPEGVCSHLRSMTADSISSFLRPCNNTLSVTAIREKATACISENLY